jgi:hypothetical protein
MLRAVFFSTIVLLTNRHRGIRVAVVRSKSVRAQLFVQPDTVVRWQKTLAAYFLAIEKQFPIERQIMEHGTIVEIVELGGLHHRYERIAA